MKTWEAAVEILNETKNPAVMWGDVVLIHQIADRMGWMGMGWRTEQRVLNALTRNPGKLIPRMTQMGNGRWVRVFRLPAQM